MCIQLQAKCLSPDDELGSAPAEFMRPLAVNMDSREKRFQNGQHEMSSQILSDQVLEIMNLMTAKPASSHVSSPSTV